MVQVMRDEGTIRDLVGEDEWQVRVDLAAAYRLVHYYGWTDMIFTHLSARVPGPEHHFLIKIIGFRDKTLLPTYDIFDEKRYFSPSKNNFNQRKNGKIFSRNILHLQF